MEQKAVITQHLETQLSLLRKALKAEISLLPPLLNQGKISRGENYHHCPYRLLDFPSHFESKDIFTFRTMIIWGHHLSWHLILGGKHKDQYQEQLLDHQVQLPQHWLFSTQEKIWTWDQSSLDYLTRPLSPTQLQSQLEAPLLKLSTFQPLDQLENLIPLSLNYWQEIRSLVII